MRKLGILVAMAAALIAIAGCQSSPKTGTTSAMPEKNKRWAKEIEEVTLSPEFERRAEEVGTRMGERIGELCASASGAEARKACFRRYTLIAFDASGLVGDHCPVTDLGDEEGDCIALAGVSFDLARRVGGDALGRFRWDDLRGSAESAMAELVRQQVEQCLASGSASDPKACVLEGVSKALGLTKEEMKPCEAFDDDKAFGDCLGQAYGLSLMVDGLARLEELSA